MSGEGLPSPPGWGREPLEGDLNIACGAVGNGQGTVWVCSSKGGSRACRRVLDQGRRGGIGWRGASRRTYLEESGPLQGWALWLRWWGGGPLPSLLLVAWGLRLLGHFAGDTRQHLRMGLWLPSLGQEWLGHRCSALMCWAEQNEHVG